MKKWENPKLESLNVDETKGAFRHIYTCKSCLNSFYTYTHTQNGTMPCDCGEVMILTDSYYNDYASDMWCPCSS